MIKTLIHIAAATVVTGALVSCSPSTPGSGSESGGAGGGESKGLIGATCLTTTNPFFIVIQNAMDDEAAKHAYEMQYLSGDKNVSIQRDQVRDFVTQGAVAIRGPNGSGDARLIFQDAIDQLFGKSIDGHLNWAFRFDHEGRRTARRLYREIEGTLISERPTPSSEKDGRTAERV